MKRLMSKAIALIVLSVFLLLTARCGGEQPTPISKSTPVPEGVEVTNIHEEETVTNKLTQHKTFNQCNSASPFNAKVRFSQSSNEQTQKKLVLGAKTGGEVGVSAVAKVALEGKIEQHFLSATTSGQAHEESVEIEVPPPH